MAPAVSISLCDGRLYYKARYVTNDGLVSVCATACSLEGDALTYSYGSNVFKDSSSLRKEKKYSSSN